MLFIVFFFGVFISWGKWGHLIYDCFKEAFLPQAILDGKVLYCDILSLYPPLGHYLNAFLYLIFGNSLHTLYFAAIINTIVILFVIYLTIKRFSSNFTAFIAVLSIILIFVFKVMNTSASWLFPYSYSFIYAFSSCLISFYMYILYKENDKNLYLLLSFLFIGLSMAFKLDFTAFILIPLYGLVCDFIKNKSFKTVFAAFLCFIAPFLISLCIYLLSGGTFSDIAEEIKILGAFANAPLSVVFNKNAMPQSFNLNVIFKVLESFLTFIIVSLILLLYIYFSKRIASKLKNPIQNLAVIILALIGYISVFKIDTIIQYQITKQNFDLAFVSYFVTISALIIFITKKIKRIEFLRCEKFYFLITAAAFLISFRTFALLYSAYIGNFMLAVWWAGFIYFVFELLPLYFKKAFENGRLKKILSIFFILYALLFFSIYLSDFRTKIYKIENKKGVYYVNNNYGYTIKEGINFIEENIPSDKKLLVIDEGLIFNYFTGRKTNLKYYSLTPFMTEGFGEDKIVEEFILNPPDYIFVSNNVYHTTGGVFGINYAKKIGAFIGYNYDFIKTIKNPEIRGAYEINIYKLKGI